MPLLPPMPRSRVVGDLACQRDSYLRTIDSEVTSCVEASPPKTNGTKNSSKKGVSTPEPERLYLIEFADSVLFPEGISLQSRDTGRFFTDEFPGGGQPTDHGTLTPLSSQSSEPIQIKSIQRQGLQCVYHSPQPLEPGTRVRQDVDFRRRWDHMQQHTGQHLLSAIMDKYDNLESVGWGMGADGDINYIDLPRKPSDEEMRTIQEKCNEAIRNNLKITVETPDDAKSDSLPEDYDKEKGVVRIIKIGDIDANPCCGTHLQQTSHIGLILLHHTQSIRGTNCRMYFSAGDRAIKLASSSVHSLRSLGGVLSSGMGAEEVLGAVKKMSDNLAESRRKEAKLLIEIAKYESERVKADLNSRRKAWVYRASGNLDYINSICFALKDALKEGGLVVLATGEKKTSGQVVVVGEKQGVEEFVEKMKGVVSGLKGGGKGERWQGKVMEWQKGEIEALKNLVES